jgi:hypothetical protein
MRASSLPACSAGYWLNQNDSTPMPRAWTSRSNAGLGVNLVVSDTTTPGGLDADGPLAKRLRGGAWEALEKTFRSL